MRHGWAAIVLVAVAGVVALAGGCGVRVSATASPSPRPAMATSTPSTPLPASPLPTSPTATPTVLPAPEPTSDADADALAAAVRRVAAAARIRTVLPTFDDLAAGMVDRSGVPGAAVAVVAGDTAAYVRCFGLRRIGRPDLVDEETLFQLGPVSRSYTTTMLAALAGDGEIGWDERVRTVWPGFRLWDRWTTAEATFRDLTAQRTGLPAYAGSELRDFGYGRREILRRLRHLRPGAGFRAAYAPQDAALTAAAVAAEEATGRTWARLVRETVLDRIGATGTTLTFHGYEEAADRASPHRLLNGSMQPREPADETVFAPSLGVAASVTDVTRYARLLLNGGALGGERVAPAATLAETTTPTTAIAAGDGGPEAAGLGWITSGHNGLYVATSAGDLASGASAAISLVPEEGVAVIVLANASPEGGVLARALTKTLLDLFVDGAPQDDWLARERDDASETDGDRVRRLSPEPPVDAEAPRARRAYEGVYENEYYGRVTVREGRGDGLNVRLGRGVTLRFAPWDGDTWRESESGTAAVFEVREGRAREVRLALLAFDGRDGRFARRP